MDRSDDELIPTRTTLLQRLKDWQDDSSWRDFFDTYWKLLYSFGIRSGLNDAEAQDVVQETMIAVARHMPGFQYDRSLGSFKTWLLNLTRWRITDQFRKRAAVPMREEFPDETATGTRTIEKVMDPAGPALDALWNEEWENNLLNAATARVKRQLDPQKYQIFDVYVNKGLPPEKVASIFGIAIDQVYLTKHRVTAMIKEEVDRLRSQMS